MEQTITMNPNKTTAAPQGETTAFGTDNAIPGNESVEKDAADKQAADTTTVTTFNTEAGEADAQPAIDGHEQEQGTAEQVASPEAGNNEPITTASQEVDVTPRDDINNTDPYGSLLWVGLGVVLVLLVAVFVFLLRKSRKKAHMSKAIDERRLTATQPAGSNCVNSVPYARPSIAIGNAQHIGNRESQQDCFGISDIYDAKMLNEKGVLVVLADGMGGMSNGDVISNAVVHEMQARFSEMQPSEDPAKLLLHLLKAAIEAAGRAQQGASKGGSTVVAALIHQSRLYFLSVGDSRICLLRNGGMIQLNREHVYGKQLDEMVTNGVLSAESAQGNKQRKALTSYIGMDGNIDIDRNTAAIDIYPGDKVVLMSDGVYNTLTEAEIIPLLLREPMQAAQAVQQSVLAKGRAHQDNLTIAILEI